MTTARTPARDTYDAIVDLGFSNETGPYAFALVKMTYRITPYGAERAAPEPLVHDLRDPEASPRLHPGTDFWPRKAATDVVVQGSAFAPQSVPTTQMRVAVSVGRVQKEIQVYGRRTLQWDGQRAMIINPPEPFTEVPLTWENAYGGVDYRVTDPALEDLPPELLAFRLHDDHPGLYPRNPFGVGYLVDPGSISGIELPQLEDPNDLLTPDRLITRDPRAWYRQPLPWCFEWMHPMMFPRYVHFVGGPDAWYPGPEDQRMPEVRRGYLASGYQATMAERPMTHGPAPAFFQGGSHGLVFPGLSPGTPVHITGMHPDEPTIWFQIPQPPVIEMQIESQRQRVVPRLHSVVCRPAEKMFYVLHGATMACPRPLIPGIHKHIPLAVSINHEAPLVYDSPVPLRDQLANALAQMQEAPMD